MSNNLDNLIADIYSKVEVLSSGKNIELDDATIEEFGDRMKAALVHWLSPKKQSKGLRMSNIG